MNAKQPGEFQRQNFSFSMQHEVLFHLVMTVSHAFLQTMSATQALEPTEEVFFHHTSALNGLQQQLSCPSGYANDSTLLSILTLLGVAESLNTLTSLPGSPVRHFYCSTGTFGAYLAGFHGVLEKRGGARTSLRFLFIHSSTLR